jgi:hypothetical protein
MKSIPLRSGAVLAAGLASLLASAAYGAQSAPAAQPEAAPAEQGSDKTEAKDTAEAPAETSDAKAEDGRICRYIKLDMSSRRKTKICRTTEEWRDLGNPR